MGGGHSRPPIAFRPSALAAPAARTRALNHLSQTRECEGRLAAADRADDDRQRAAPHAEVNVVQNGGR
jgi:hypothetical protein